MREFDGFGKFAEHLAAVAVAEDLLIKRALGHCAKLVEEEAKAEIGDYQDQAGPFVAWAELAESTKADRVAKGFAEDEPLLRTGDMRDSIGVAISPDGMEAQIGSNSDIAVYQELGTERIPPRSFLGGAMARKLPEIQAILGEAVHAALIGDAVFEGRLAIENDDV